MNDQSIYREFGGMCWAVPGKRLDELHYGLVHGTLSRSQQLCIASALSCYTQLVGLPERERNRIIRELRKGPNIPRSVAEKPTPAL